MKIAGARFAYSAFSLRITAMNASSPMIACRVRCR